MTKLFFIHIFRLIWVNFVLYTKMVLQMRPWKDHENVPEIRAKIIWRSLEIEQVLSLID